MAKHLICEVTYIKVKEIKQECKRSPEHDKMLVLPSENMEHEENRKIRSC